MRISEYQWTFVDFYQGQEYFSSSLIELEKSINRYYNLTNYDATKHPVLRWHCDIRGRESEDLLANIKFVVNKGNVILGNVICVELDIAMPFFKKEKIINSLQKWLEPAQVVLIGEIDLQ